MTRKCLGYSVSTWNRCGSSVKKGRYFCRHHKRQPIKVAFFLVFSVVAGMASISSCIDSRSSGIEPVAPEVLVSQLDRIESRLDELSTKIEFSEVPLTRRDEEIADLSKQLATAKTAVESLSRENKNLKNSLLERLRDLEKRDELSHKRQALARQVQESGDVEAILSLLETFGISQEIDNRVLRIAVTGPDGQKKVLNAENGLKPQLEKELEEFAPDELAAGTWDPISLDCIGAPTNCGDLDFGSRFGSENRKLRIEWFSGGPKAEAEMILARMSGDEASRSFRESGMRLCQWYNSLGQISLDLVGPLNPLA